MTDKRSHIAVTSPIDPIIYEELGKLYTLVTAANDERQTLLDLMPHAFCLISRGLAPIDGEIMDASQDLLAISRTGAGYENIDIAAATQRGLPVVYAPLLSESVAEAAFAVILALNKQLFYWHDALLNGHWDRRITERTDELYARTLGIVGLGRIGRAVARRARSFDMRIVACDPYLDAAQTAALEVELLTLDELLESADVVNLHALSTPETDGLINRENLQRMKRGAYLVNFARGGTDRRSGHTSRGP